MGNETHRPLLNVDNPIEQIKMLMSQREQFYSKADLTIETDELEVDEVVNIIIKKIER